MKKNIAMRVAAFLFILTMISTCAFATTFAKYTTSDSTTDSARVAKWGVEVEVAAHTDGMFSETYGDTVNAEAGVHTISKLVAPGTGVTDAVTVTITGKPEVDVEIQYKATVVLEGWEQSYTYNETPATTFCPLVITVNGQDYKVKAGKTAADLASAVKAAIEGKSVAKIDANTTLNGTNNLEVSWAWAFETGSTDAEKEANNINDTALGDAVAKGNIPTISITVECIVTQID